MSNEIKLLTKAYFFSALKHARQRRKGSGNIPYINHPVHVANLIAQTVGTDDMLLLAGAVLHDILEDTDTREEEVSDEFGGQVLKIVKEVTDDTTLSREERKAEQIRRGPYYSSQARIIKVADKSCNIMDMVETLGHWNDEQKKEYIRHAISLVEICRGVNTSLDSEFDNAVLRAGHVLGTL